MGDGGGGEGGGIGPQKTLQHVLQIWLGNASLRIIQAARDKQTEKQCGKCRKGEREGERERERERGGVCVNEGQVRTEKWHLTRSAAFAYFVANCCSTGC